VAVTYSRYSGAPPNIEEMVPGAAQQQPRGEEADGGAAAKPSPALSVAAPPPSAEPSADEDWEGEAASEAVGRTASRGRAKAEARRDEPPMAKKAKSSRGSAGGKGGGGWGPAPKAAPAKRSPKRQSADSVASKPKPDRAPPPRSTDAPADTERSGGGGSDDTPRRDTGGTARDPGAPPPPAPEPEAAAGAGSAGLYDEAAEEADAGDDAGEDADAAPAEPPAPAASQTNKDAAQEPSRSPRPATSLSVLVRRRGAWRPLGGHDIPLGEAIRVQAVSGSAPYLAVIGIDGSGNVVAVVPTGGSRAVAVRPGQAVQSATVELRQPGRLRLYLLLYRDAFSTTDVLRGLRGQPGQLSFTGEQHSLDLFVRSRVDSPASAPRQP
jgi:hypothetical protein